MREGFSVHTIPKPTLPLKAAYGVYLIKLIKEADARGEEEGRFIDIEPMSFEEFKQQRKDANRKKLFKNDQN